MPVEVVDTPGGCRTTGCNACRVKRWPAAWSNIPLSELAPRPRPPDARTAWRGPAFGLAVDIGTTHLRASLWDLADRRSLGARRGANPQAISGLDILSRLAAAVRHPSEALRLRTVVRAAIGDALTDLARQAQRNPADIARITLVGNTGMLALFAGVPVDRLIEPDAWDRPFDCAVPDAADCARAWGIHPDADVTVVPALGGFVGSDLTASVLATGQCDGPAGSVLIDFGTNSEIALWDGRTLWVTSAAGGPAFEGCGVSCGAPAGAGAVHRVTAIPGTADGLRCEVIGGGEPIGLAGSGLVDAIALLRESGALTAAGRFARPRPDGVLLARGHSEIRLRPRDIDTFQRAKAAIGAALESLLQRAGFPPDRLTRLYICGAFGRDLSVAHAQAVGLLPPVPSRAVSLHEDAALAGCEHLLTDPVFVSSPGRARPDVRVINLAHDPTYEDGFISHLRLQPQAGTEGRRCSTIW